MNLLIRLIILYLAVITAYASEKLNVYWCEGTACIDSHQNVIATIVADSLMTRLEMDKGYFGIMFIGIYGKILEKRESTDRVEYILSNIDRERSLYAVYGDHSIFTFDIKGNLSDPDKHYLLFAPCMNDTLVYEGHLNGCFGK